MASDPQAQSPKLIIYIEDDLDSIAFAKLALKGQPYEVLAITDPTKSLAALHEHQPDLVLLDIMMPAMNGWDVLRRIRNDEKLAHIPVIIVTARDSRLDEVYGTLIANVQGYMRKPFDYQKFKAAVAHALANSDGSDNTADD